MVAAFLLLAAGWALYRAHVFLGETEARQIELAEPDEIWRDIADASVRARMH